MMKYYFSIAILLLLAAAASANAGPNRSGSAATRARVSALKPTDTVNPEELGDLFEGDIVNPPWLRNGVADDKYRWPNGKVPFVFAEDEFTAEDFDTIHRAFDDFASITDGCITFLPRTTERDYILFQSTDSGCYSWVGRIGGEQVINYQPTCLTRYGTVQHEMLHALGFYHEQSRFDRDDYVTINWDNIAPGSEGNFKRYPEDVATGFGEDYDYGSVMHYSRVAFSINGESTITPHDPDAVIGQREFVSAADIEKLKRMYNCN